MMRQTRKLWFRVGKDIMHPMCKMLPTFLPQSHPWMYGFRIQNLWRWWVTDGLPHFTSGGQRFCSDPLSSSLAIAPVAGSRVWKFWKTSGAQKIAGIWVKRVINPLDFEASQWCILVTRVTVSRGAIHAIPNALATGSHPNLSQPRAEFVS